MNKRRLQLNAFTLLELLVVIAILSMLVALLMPALSSAKTKAKRLHCLSNVRQLVIGLQEYASDRHFYPLYFEAASNNDGQLTGAGWNDEIARQLGDNPKTPDYYFRGVWLCPAAQMKDVQGPAASYGYSLCGLGFGADSLGLGGTHGLVYAPGRASAFDVKPPVSDSAVVRPSAMIAISDGFHGNGDQIVSGDWFLWRHDYSAYPGRGANAAAVRARHRGKANIVFCDGHVESPTLKFLFQETGDGALAKWNRDNLPHRERLGTTGSGPTSRGNE